MQSGYTARTDQNSNVWVDAELGRGYRVAQRISYANGKPEVVEIRVHPGPGAGRLTQELWRSVRLTGWEDALPENTLRRKNTLRNAGPPELVTDRIGRKERARGKEKSLQLAFVAAAYTQAWKDGHRNHNEVAAEDLGESSEWVRDRVMEARAVGYLPPTKRGRGGGGLTPRGRAVIEGWHQEFLRALDEPCRVLRQFQAIRDWLSERALEEGVDTSSMTHREWKAWAKARLASQNFPLRE